MRITVIAKNAGKRKELGKRQIELVKTPQTLQQLLEELTLVGLADAQAERNNQPLTQSDIDAQAEEGRVKFAENFATNNDTPEKSLERMRQAFVDGLFRVFADGEELTQWEGSISLKEDSELVSFASPCSLASVGDAFSNPFTHRQGTLPWVFSSLTTTPGIIISN